MGIPERRNREREARRTGIRRSALRLLMAEGLGAVTLRRVAAEAELSVTALYAYYPSRSSLLAGILDEFLDGVIRRAAEAEEAGDSGSETLRKVAESYLSVVGASAFFFDLLEIRKELDPLGPALGDRDGTPGIEAAERLMAALRAALVRGEHDGSFSLPASADATARSIVLMVLGIAESVARAPGDERIELLGTELKRIFGVILNGLSSHPRLANMRSRSGGRNGLQVAEA